MATRHDEMLARYDGMLARHDNDLVRHEELLRLAVENLAEVHRILDRLTGQT